MSTATISFVEDLIIMVEGFTIVMLTLTLLFAVMVVIGRFFMAYERRGQAGEAGKAGMVADGTTGVPSPEVCAVVAAAVHVALGSPHRVVQITSPGFASANVWGVEGRREIFSSHRVR